MTATASSYNPTYRYGDPMPVKMPWKTAVAVNVGDLVYADSTDSYTVKPASSITWASAVATPSAPTVTNSGVAMGSNLTAALTGVKISYQFPWGEGALSTAGTCTPTLHAAIILSGFAVPAPVIGVNIYVETSAGSGTYQLWDQLPVAGGVFGITGATGLGDTYITGYGIGSAPTASAVTSASLDITQYNFAQAFAGVSAQQYDGTNGTAYGINDGFLRVDTAGVFDYACASATWNVGDWFGVAKDTGNNLYQQKVVKVTAAPLAIGRAVQAGTNSTTVRLRLYSSRREFPHM